MALDGGAGAGPLLVRRRRPLPGTRAVLGGFLVAVAAVGVYAASAGATRVPLTSYVVAAHEIAPGAVVRADDLTLEAMHLPDTLARGGVFRSPSSVIGAVALAPLHAGELVQASAVAPGSATGRQLSFAVDPSRAVDGALRAGERVDVLATYGTGADAYSIVVVRRALVVDARTGSAGLGSQHALVVTLRVASEEQALAVAHAVSAGSVTLVRADTTDDAAAPVPAPYRPRPGA